MSNNNKRQRIAEENQVLLQIWHSSQRGDSLAFRDLADRLYRTLFNYAFNFSSDREFIKDSIQELLITVWEKRERIHMEFVVIYFLTAMRNQLIRAYRRPDNSLSFLDIDNFNQLSDYKTVEGEMVESEAYARTQYRVRSAIDDLPKRQREAIFLKYYEGLENDKIAELMQINRQSVANLLFKALTSIKAQMA